MDMQLGRVGVACALLESIAHPGLCPSMMCAGVPWLADCFATASRRLVFRVSSAGP